MTTVPQATTEMYEPVIDTNNAHPPAESDIKADAAPESKSQNNVECKRCAEREQRTQSKRSFVISFDWALIPIVYMITEMVVKIVKVMYEK